MRIVHFSIKPLAGAPINLVTLLRQYSNHEIYLVDLHRLEKFEQDLVFSEDEEKIMGLVQTANIIHLHNYLDLDSTEFAPINFQELHKNGIKIIKQFHSAPSVIAREMGKKCAEVTNPAIPSIVIAQFQERFYPNSRVVPNPISPLVKKLKPENGELNTVDLFYSSTNGKPAFSKRKYESARWNTKARHEVINTIRKLEKGAGINSDIVKKVPFEIAIKRKWRARIVIDDCVTGSYHLSGLEALVMGKVAISYLDNRTTAVLREISGSETMPFVNAPLESLEMILESLLRDRNACDEIGRLGAKWIEKYWPPDKVASVYETLYEDLITDPSKIIRQNSLRLDSEAKRFNAILLPDLTHKTRCRQYYKLTTLHERILLRLNERK